MYDNRNRILALLIMLTLIFSLFTLFISSKEEISLSAKSAALYEPETRNFLYLKNANERLAMASTTKIMTALIALETLDLKESFVVDSRAIGVEGSSIYLKPGEKINTLDLIYSVLLQSANDATAALAYKIADSIEGFADLMNERARSIGANDTNFKNPHGLDQQGHYTTAHDLAIMTAEALKNENFKKISSTYKKEITTSQTKRILVNHNKLLNMYNGCIGVKTGYTKKSGRSLSSAAERDNLTLICITIDAPSDWQDHTKLLDYGYSLLEAVVLAEPDSFCYEIPILCGSSPTVKISNQEKIKKIFSKGDTDFDTHVKLSRYFSAPIKKGDILGTVIFTKNGEEIARLPLLAENNVDVKQNKNRFFSIFNR